MTETPCLFQFRKIDNYLFQTLINRKLWFSSPRVFNDPFDCQLPILTDNSQEEITKYLLVLNEQFHHYSSKDEVAQRAKDLFEDKEELKGLLYRIIFEQRRFSCFVDKENLVYSNSTMWGNYADKSKGICLKFQFENEIEESFKLKKGITIAPLRIDYKNAIPTFNHIRHKLGIRQDVDSTSQYYFGIKSKYWEDESEVRLIIDTSTHKFEKDYETVTFRASCLKEIILGCNSEQEDSDVISNIIHCNPEYSHVKIKQLKKSEKRFGFDPI